MEVNPIILNNVVYDTYTRILYSPETPPYPIESMHTPIECSTELPDLSDCYTVNRPTVLMNYLHSCFGHAYVDTTIPLLSILHEYSPEILSNRGFQLFIFKDRFQDISSDKGLIDHLNRWESQTVDYERGAYTGSYRHFHECFSDCSILFEKVFSAARYIKFNTILFGGNISQQRTIHNCDARYPDRVPTPVATDLQIAEWVNKGKEIFGRYIGVRDRPRQDVLLIARRGTREFTLRTLTRLEYTFNTDPVYLEDYSLAEQIQMFKDADTIVSAHGSGLYHLLWCAPGTRVIEIFATDDSRKRIFQSYAEFLGLKYSRIECSSEQRTTDERIDLSKI